MSAYPAIASCLDDDFEYILVFIYSDDIELYHQHNYRFLFDKRRFKTLVENSANNALLDE